MAIGCFAYVPQDILLAIDDYISPEDRYSCLFVCRHWYSVYIAKQFKHLNVYGAQPCQHLSQEIQLDTLRYFECRKDRLTSLGQLIKHLNIELEATDLEKSEDLPEQCCNLQSFRVSSVWTRSQKPIRTIDPTLWKLSRNLSRLDLLVPQLQKDATLTLLAGLPNLAEVDLNWICGPWTVHDMDAIHDSCRKLKSVSICAEMFLSDNWDIETLTRPCNFPKAPTLQRFRLSIYSGLATRMGDWFAYSGRNYPQLEHFTLEARPRHLVRSGIRLPASGSILILCEFMQTCPLYGTIATVSLRALVRVLFASNMRIRHFGTTKGFSGMVSEPVDNWFFHSTLQSLYLATCMDVGPESAPFLKYFGGLRRLHIGTHDNLCLLNVLTSYEALEHLTIERLTLATREIDITDPVEHRYLKSLTFNSSVLPGCILGIAAASCPELTYFAIEDCVVAHRGKAVTHINLSRSELEHILLRNVTKLNNLGTEEAIPRSTKQDGLPLMIFGLEQEKNSTEQHWFDLSLPSTDTDQISTLLGLRPSPMDSSYILQRLQTEALLAIAITCQAVEQIHINRKRLLY